MNIKKKYKKIKNEKYKKRNIKIKFKKKEKKDRQNPGQLGQRVGRAPDS